MAHYLNPRGYTWQTYLRKAWWRLALTAGMGVVFWWGSRREATVAEVFILAIILLDTLGRPLVRGFREGWRSQ
jgi:hypothetical protein